MNEVEKIEYIIDGMLKDIAFLMFTKKITKNAINKGMKFRYQVQDRIKENNKRFEEIGEILEFCRNY